MSELRRLAKNRKSVRLVINWLQRRILDEAWHIERMKKLVADLTEWLNEIEQDSPSKEQSP